MQVFTKVQAGLRRLIRDEGGNTFVIVAAAVIPLMGVVGGGLDLARAHLAKSRLSQACDAAALAGRRAMTNDDVETAKPEATKFFNYNFPQGYMETTAFTPAITKPERGTIQIAVNTSVPTTIMKIFNSQSLPISVTCQATQNFDNIDIVLVLDTTGSMAQNIDGDMVGDGDSTSKMAALRRAVMGLYDELQSAQTELAAQGLRLRYGIVPYSSAVNVGKLIYAKNPGYMATSWTYQSRVGVGYNSSGAYVWNYKPVTYDVTNYLAGGTLTAPTGANGANVNFTWAGCIEERETTASITSTTSPDSIPASAKDLDIDLIPNDNATRWKAYLADPWSGTRNVYASPVYGRNTDAESNSGWSPQRACPREAKRLGAMTRSEMENYVNSLYSDGGTYHDNGMRWGLRFISPTGIFGTDNPSTFGGRPVKRYIIFMTDGIMDTGSTIYGSYGIEWLNKRITGGFTSDADQVGRHKQRFLMMCNAAKAKEVSIYSIVFASAPEDTLSECASNDDQYKYVETASELEDTFKEIGKNIGALRLKQ